MGCKGEIGRRVGSLPMADTPICHLPVNCAAKILGIARDSCRSDSYAWSKMMFHDAVCSALQASSDKMVHHDLWRDNPWCGFRGPTAGIRHPGPSRSRCQRRVPSRRDAAEKPCEPRRNSGWGSNTMGKGPRDVWRGWRTGRTSSSCFLSWGTMRSWMTRCDSSRSSMMYSLRSASMAMMMDLIEGSHSTKTPGGYRVSMTRQYEDT